MKTAPHEWILIRGLTRESRHWGNFPATLQKFLPDTRMTTLDLPGTGRERHRSSPSSTRAIARDLLGRFKNDHPCYVLGLSFGGLVALEMVRLAPERFRGGALVNASLAQFSPMFQRLRPRGLKTIMNALLTRNLISRETQIYRITSNKPEREPEWVAKWAQIAGDSPVSVRTLLKQLLAAATYRPKTPPRGIPFVVCTSQGDRLVHPDCSERLAWWLGAKFKKHPSAGHDLPLDDPEWLAQVLMKWSKDG